VEAFLEELYKDAAIPGALAQAARYSLLAGGKRIRPVLCLTCASLCGLEPREAMPFAAALEMIHSYSLIHDDLPAMDNDDLRRGKPSNHKMFGEAAAILAGDALLTDSFALMALCSGADGPLPPVRVLEAMRLVSRAAGSAGMVGGQFLDIEHSKSGTDSAPATVEGLARMQALKTGALLRVSCLSGAVLAGASEKAMACIDEYGAAIGATFQVVDDILDQVGDEAQLGKPVGSDMAQGKLTWPALVGLDASRQRAREFNAKAQAALDRLPGEELINAEEMDVLRGLAEYLLERVS
jgi:geranylgeranyl diphosphate synthase type II